MISKQKNNGLPVYPWVGSLEKPILDNLEKCFNYPIERQYEVAGYFLDGFCSALNLAIEIDEKHHLRNDVNLKDQKREIIIKEKLHCNFLRIEAYR